MVQRIFDDFRASAGSAVRLTSLAAAAMLTLLITTSFLCAAAFVFVLQNYGLVQACLTGAGVFAVVTVIVAGCYIVWKSKAETHAAHAASTAKSSMHTALADPMVVAVGIQVIRAIGIKKLVPVLAIGGVALGLLASLDARAGETSAE